MRSFGGYGPAPTPPPSPEEQARQRTKRIKNLLDSEPELPQDAVLGTPLFQVRSRGVSEKGHTPGPWATDLETDDIAPARRLARAIRKQGWVEVMHTLWET